MYLFLFFKNMKKIVSDVCNVQGKIEWKIN
jgi:hypothetical protein